MHIQWGWRKTGEQVQSLTCLEDTPALASILLSTSSRSASTSSPAWLVTWQGATGVKAGWHFCASSEHKRRPAPPLEPECTRTHRPVQSYTDLCNHMLCPAVHACKKRRSLSFTYVHSYRAVHAFAPQKGWVWPKELVVSVMNSCPDWDSTLVSSLLRCWQCWDGG